MGKTVAIAAGGALCTAIAFGPARMGYGLFLPTFRDAFSLSTAQAGLIASSAFGAFFLALLVSAHCVTRYGSRVPVCLGSAAAAIGMALVAGTQDARLFTAGIVLAATSAGLCWSPFNDAVGRAIVEKWHGRVLSVVSTGTTFGIAGAGILALAVAMLAWDWRTIWFGFAALALACALYNLAVLGRLPRATASPLDRDKLRRLLNRAIRPIYWIAVSFGVTNGIYLSFATDQIESAGGLAGLQADGAGAILFIAFGVGGVVGLWTADVERRIGLRRLVQGVFLCSAASLLALAFGASSWAGLIVSAALQGLCLMSLSALFSFISQRLYPDISSVSFTAVLTVYALGNVVGPALAGYLASATSLMIVFISAAVLSLVTGVLFRARHT
ncbi:MFS transporter [Salinicola halophilus]|uniref:MFS transporter n=1 Tax=Salinicola halophilus TaxID=184065 RepID=UPI000DA1E7F9|nr:MFS transporter [Salinicola halophilus]